jgi:hypothetical protein
MESLRAEWRELPKRRDTALLKGDKDALLDTQIRERQIPYEYLQAIRQRTELFTEQVHAQLNDLAKQREQVRARLVEALPKLEAAWREVDALQQEYLRLAQAKPSCLCGQRAWGVMTCTLNTERAQPAN